MARRNTQDKTFDKVFTYLCVIATIVLLAFSGLAFWAHTFTTNMVREELAAQKVYFPPKGSSEFDPAMYPDIQKYAGQLVDSAPEAKAYANSYIARHLQKVAGGKVYAEVSAESMKDPGNMKLQQQKQTLLQGETLRGILLSTGYAYGTIGAIAGIAAYICLAASACTAFLAIAFLTKFRA